MKWPGLAAQSVQDIFTRMKGDIDIPLYLSFFARTKSFSYLASWVPPVIDGHDLSVFSEILQKMQDPPVYLCNNETRCFTANPQQKWPQGHR